MIALVNLSHVGLLDSDEIPEEQILGFLVGIVHHQFVKPIEYLDRIMTQAGLPDEHWPHKPKAKKSFEAACRGLESPRFQDVILRDPGTGMDIKFRVEFMIDVLRDGSRQLSRKINYMGNEEASKQIKDVLEVYVETTQKEPEKMAKFSYDKATDSVVRTNLYENPESLDIGLMADEKYAVLVESFNLIKKCYTERYLKDAWHRMVRRTGGVPWLKSSGSFWFIPKDARVTVEAFGTIYNTLHNGGGTWRSSPVVDTRQQREYLRDDVMREYQDRYSSFLENVASRLESNMDDEKKRELIMKNRDKFEESLDGELIKRYNRLLNMSISAKVKDVDVSVESSRALAALDYLRNL